MFPPHQCGGERPQRDIRAGARATGAMSGWAEAPLRQSGSGGSLAHGDHAAGLLGPGPYRTSSGQTDGASPRLPSPHNRTPFVTEPPQRPHSDGSYAPQGQPSWHRCPGPLLGGKPLA